MRRLGIDDKQTTPRSVLSHISWAKNHMLDPQEVYLQSGDPKTEKVAHIYEEYRKELRKANALDFDDLLLETVRLLKAVPAVRDYYNRRYQYVMIDEYQDTNRPQYELMRLLAGPITTSAPWAMKTSRFIPGAARTFATFWSLKRTFPKPRSSAWNRTTVRRRTFCRRRRRWSRTTSSAKARTFGPRARVAPRSDTTKRPDGENEALFAADYISKYLREAVDQGENARAAVLYRTNSQSRLFEEAMRRYGLKYHVVGGFSFYERAEIKDMISYLKVIHNPDDSISLLRVINTPVRGIGKTSIETLERVALETGLSLWGAIAEVIKRQLLPPRAVAALKSFTDIIEDGRAILGGNDCGERWKKRQRRSSRQSDSRWPRACTAKRISDPEISSDDDTDFEPGNFVI